MEIPLSLHSILTNDITWHRSVPVGKNKQTSTRTKQTNNCSYKQTKKKAENQDCWAAAHHQGSACCHMRVHERSRVCCMRAEQVQGEQGKGLRMCVSLCVHRYVSSRHFHGNKSAMQTPLFLYCMNSPEE